MNVYKVQNPIDPMECLWLLFSTSLMSLLPFIIKLSSLDPLRSTITHICGVYVIHISMGYEDVRLRCTKNKVMDSKGKGQLTNRDKPAFISHPPVYIVLLVDFRSTSIVCSNRCRYCLFEYIRWDIYRGIDWHIG